MMILESGKELYSVKLNNPIIIEVEESEEKDLIKFNKKLDKLYKLLNLNIPNTPETNEAIDKLITIISQNTEDED